MNKRKVIIASTVVVFILLMLLTIFAIKSLNGKNELLIFKDGDMICDNDDDCDKLAFKIKVESENAKMLSNLGSVDNGYILFEDNGYIKLYKITDKQTNVISKYDSLSRDYDLEFLNDDNDRTPVAISYHTNNNTQNEMFDNCLIDIETGKLLTKVESDSELDRFTIDNNYIIYADYDPNSEQFTSNIYYTRNGKKLFESPEHLISHRKSKIYYSYDNIIHEADEYKDDIINKDFSDYKIKKIISNHVVAIKDAKLIIINLDDLKEYELIDWDDSYELNSLLSEYITEGNSIESGYYITIDSSEGERGIEIYFDPDTKEVYQSHAYLKPILYLYPNAKTAVSVSFTHPNYLTTTYPKFNSGWKVTAYPNGDLYDSDGKYYYGLYWEESIYHKDDFNEGFYVEKEDAIQFLEEKLSYIGLNDKERNEFIMYWLPILEKNEKNLIHFELTEDRDCYNKLIINPKPDSLLRISIHVKKVNEKVSIKEQKLEKFERIGFSAIEWGGVQY